MASESHFRGTRRIFVAGHRGLVGSAIVRRLETLGCDKVLVRSRSELDLREQSAVDRFFRESRPEFVFLAAAKVGGILANATQPAEFLYRQSRNSDQRHSLGLDSWLSKAALSWILMYLSAAGAPAYQRRVSAHWSVGVDQRSVCDRQDRRAKDGSRLPCPARFLDDTV